MDYLTNEDPCDNIDMKDLSKWIQRNDSSSTNNINDQVKVSAPMKMPTMFKL